MRIEAIVLAAGAGSRFGGGKLTASLEGRPVIRHVVETLALAGLPVTVVVGEDGDAIRAAIGSPAVRTVLNPDPSRGLSSSLQLGLAALGPEVDAVFIALGDQPRLSRETIEALRSNPPTEDRPIVVPRYDGDGAINPVFLGRNGFELAARTEGDRGLGPVIRANPDLIRDVPIPGANPDVDTRADLVRLLETAWSRRVAANRDQVDRVREVPDGSDFYAPVTCLFRADPGRLDDPSLDALLRLVRPGDTWLDIGAGAGRYALPIAARLASSDGRVIALDPSVAMLGALQEAAEEAGITNVEVVEGRWPPPSPDPFRADIALIAHVSYDVEAIGPFIAGMEGAARRACVAILMERQPSSIADVCWPPVHGEGRVALPALPEFVELLEAMGRQPTVERLERHPRSFDDMAQLEGFLRRQLWISPGGEADRRFTAALDDLVVSHPDGGMGLRDQKPSGIGVVTWALRP